MKNLWCIIAIFTILPLAGFAQTNFYSTDSLSIYGEIKMKEGSDIENSKFCQVIKDTLIYKYSPYQVNQYGFKNGRVYESFFIMKDDSLKRYFLEKLVSGKKNLYYLKTEEEKLKFYLTSNEGLIPVELPVDKKEYSSLLESLLNDCPQAVLNIPYIKLKKHSLKRFVNDYNTCAKRPFPRIRYGFSFGITASELSAVRKKSIYAKPAYDEKLNYTIGTFMDIPLYSSNYSFHPEIYFKQFGLAKAIDFESKSHDLVINTSSLTIPLLFRYTALKNKISPYVQMGPVYSRTIRNNSSLYEYKSVNNITSIEIIKSQPFKNNMGGFSIGTGAILNYGSKVSWFCELSYDQLYNLWVEDKLLNVRDVNFKIGLLF